MVDTTLSVARFFIVFLEITIGQVTTIVYLVPYAS